MVSAGGSVGCGAPSASASIRFIGLIWNDGGIAGRRLLGPGSLRASFSFSFVLVTSLHLTQMGRALLCCREGETLEDLGRELVELLHGPRHAWRNGRHQVY